MANDIPRTPADAASVMQFLWDKHQILNADELGWLSRATETANTMARGLGRVIEGVGCLVANDGGDAGPGAGNFRGTDDLPALLFAIANQVSVIGELCLIGSDAKALLHQMGGRHD